MNEKREINYANDYVYRICSWMVSGQLSNGQLATLRRASPPAKPPAFYWLTARVEKQLLEKNIAPNDEERWSLLVHCLAILTPPGNIDYENPGSSQRNPHRKKIPLGQAFFDAGLSELRLASLLDARGEQLTQKLIRCCRYLASKKEKLNAEELALLIFHNTSNSPLFNKTRQTIARDYYRRTNTSAANMAKDAS